MAVGLGNIIDCTFYGVFLNNAPPDAPFKLFHGQVIDMLYFPIVEGYYPEWFPFWQGEEFIFFRPVFNLADTSISTGVISIFVFQKRFFNQLKKEEPAISATEELPGDTTANEARAE